MWMKWLTSFDSVSMRALGRGITLTDFSFVNNFDLWETYNRKVYYDYSISTDVKCFVHLAWKYKKRIENQT